jgi:D-3-phosphoglycerate dehydrogenase
MKVLIADKFEKVGIDGLKELGCTVVMRPELTAEELPAALTETDPSVLIVRSTKVTAVALNSGASLGLVIRAGAGIDTIDVPAASARGVFVSNCPGRNSVAVAELVMALLLSCDRRVPDQVADSRAGTWNKAEYSRARGLHGRTLGIVGLGQIGREIAVRAKAFGMHVAAWSRNLTIESAEQLGVTYCETPLEVARVSDAVSINVAATGETKDLVNAEFLGSMRPGAYLINTSRGSVVDEPALGRTAPLGQSFLDADVRFSSADSVAVLPVTNLTGLLARNDSLPRTFALVSEVLNVDGPPTFGVLFFHPDARLRIVYTLPARRPLP